MTILDTARKILAHDKPNRPLPLQHADDVRALCRALLARDAALRECETVMTMVEPRSRKAEYLAALFGVRRALAADE